MRQTRDISSRRPVARPMSCSMRRCVINLALCTPNGLNRVIQIGSYEYVLEAPFAGLDKERQMSSKGKSVLLAVSALGLVLAGAGPALAQGHTGGGGGHAGGHSMGGGHAAVGHVG